jgi:hypothetical protein
MSVCHSTPALRSFTISLFQSVSLAVCHSDPFSLLCHYVTLSLCQYVSLFLYSCSLLCLYVTMSVCQFFSLSLCLCHYITLSVCQFVSLLLCLICQCPYVTLYLYHSISLCYSQFHTHSHFCAIFTNSIATFPVTANHLIHIKIHFSCNY